MRHIDEFISLHEDSPTDASNKIAAEWFRLFRRPAIDKVKKPNPDMLFCTYKGNTYRVTGCSRLGDVWLHSDFKEPVRYELRVDVDECSNFSSYPPVHKNPNAAAPAPIQAEAAKPATDEPQKFDVNISWKMAVSTSEIYVIKVGALYVRFPNTGGAILGSRRMATRFDSRMWALTLLGGVRDHLQKFGKLRVKRLLTKSEKEMLKGGAKVWRLPPDKEKK